MAYGRYKRQAQSPVKRIIGNHRSARLWWRANASLLSAGDPHAPLSDRNALYRYSFTFVGQEDA